MTNFELKFYPTRAEIQNFHFLAAWRHLLLQLIENSENFDKN